MRTREKSETGSTTTHSFSSLAELSSENAIQASEASCSGPVLQQKRVSAELSLRSETTLRLTSASILPRSLPGLRPVLRVLGGGIEMPVVLPLPLMPVQIAERRSSSSSVPYPPKLIPPQSLPASPISSPSSAELAGLGTRSISSSLACSGKRLPRGAERASRASEGMVQAEMGLVEEEDGVDRTGGTDEATVRRWRAASDMTSARSAGPDSD